MTDVTKKERIVWIDILRGAMMFFVVCGHTMTDPDVKQYIFSFHMPIYFIISGMTFSFNKEYDPAKYLAKKVKGLLVPYLSLNLLVSGLWYLNRSIGKVPYYSTTELIKGILVSNVDYDLPMASNTTWFITCLFLTDIIFFALKKLTKNDIQLTAFTLLCVTTFYSLGGISQKGGGIWHWRVAFTALIPYLLGYIFMKNIGAVRKAVTEHRLISVMTAAVLLFDGFLLSVLNGRVSMVNNNYKNTLFFYLSSSSTSLAFIILVMLLSEYPLFIKLASPINFIGKNTLTYIAFHVPIVKLIKYFFSDFFYARQLNMLLCAAAVYIALIPIAWLVRKLLPFAVGMGFVFPFQKKCDSYVKSNITSV